MTLALSSGSAMVALAQEQPNIVIIFADDMGYGDISCNNPMGRAITPNIDKLAEQGLSFSDAHSGGAVSTPSRYGLVTGQYFFRAAKPENDYPNGHLKPLITPDRETIGSLMQRAGYTTGCVGKWHLGLDWFAKDSSQRLITDNGLGRTNIDYSKGVANDPTTLGFDYSYIMPASLDMPPYLFIENQKVVDSDMVLTGEQYPNLMDDTKFSWDRKHTGDKDVYWDRGVWWRNGEMSASYKVEDCLDVIADKGIEFIERSANKSKPFMLYLPLTGPHTPWMPNEEFKGTTALGTYGDFIAQIDNIVARVEAKLKELGVDDNTIVIFSSDNGGAWQEDDVLQYSHHSNWGSRGMKGDAWDGGHHIPLIIKYPGVAACGESYDHTVSLVDLLATFSELTGEPIKEGYAEDSFSLLSTLKGDLKTPTRDHIIYISSANTLAIKEGDWKYIDGLGSRGFSAPSRLEPVKGGPKGQLYNLKNDPLESKNLYLSEPQKVEELSSLLYEYRDRGYTIKR